ncbi:MAG: YchJ family protein [Cyanophyceae cyanobacterium]
MIFNAGGYSPSLPCPCGEAQEFWQCCGPYLQGKLSAPTAEKLMRSRYSAYFTKNVDYLFKTQHPKYRKLNMRQQITEAAKTKNWAGLTILDRKKGQARDKTGVVEFVALYRVGDALSQLRERSRFQKEGDQWFYLDGDLLPPYQPKRGEPCWCKSGKKFKHCHGKK